MVDLLLGYLRKSLDEFSMTGTPGSVRRRSWPWAFGREGWQLLDPI